MAHFAKLDENNVVTQVITFSNEEVNANGGELSTEAENFVSARHGGTWKQTSYNGNFRGRFAGIDFTYDVSKDEFICFQPFPSWTLDENNDWQPPVSYPTKEQCQYTIDGSDHCYVDPKWEEDRQKWSSLHASDTVYDWNGTTWSQVTPIITKEEYDG